MIYQQETTKEQSQELQMLGALQEVYTFQDMLHELMEHYGVLLQTVPRTKLASITITPKFSEPLAIENWNVADAMSEQRHFGKAYETSDPFSAVLEAYKWHLTK